MQKNFAYTTFARCLWLLVCLWLLPSGNAAVEGTVVAWGNNSDGQSTVPTNLSGVVAIAAGGFHSLAVRFDGSVVAWGRNDYGQTNVPVGLSDVIAVSAGGYFSLALKRNGTVVGWGANEVGQIAVPAGLTDVVAIASGWNHGLALKAGGTVVGWGQNNTGQAAPGTNAIDLQGTAGGEAHSIALTRSGKIIGWGAVSVPALTDIVAIAANGYHDLALHRDGTVIAWGVDGGQAATVPNLTGVVGIAAGYSHSLALKGDGTVVAWAVPDQWQVPTNLSGVIAIAAGFSHSLALQSSGSPLGAPRLFVDGTFVTTSNVYARAASATISLYNSFGTRFLLYTLDGSDPSLSGILYEQPLVLRHTATIRAVAYNADFTQSALSDPVEVIILPTLNAATDGGGSVAIDPPTGAYFSDGTATVTAAPAAGWTFLQWIGDVTGTNLTVNLSMNRNKYVRAIFGTALSNNVVGSGSLIRSPAGGLYPYGTKVQLTAVPQPGNYFVLWGNAASGSNNPLTFTITDAGRTVAALFASLSDSGTYALAVVPNGVGQVSASPTANRYSVGTNVTLTALPEAGQDFLGWSGDAGGANNPLVVTMNQSKVIIANFSARPRLAMARHTAEPNSEEFQLTLTGELGAVYRIDASADFEAWSTVTTLTNALGLVQFNEPFGTNAHRFFRATRIP